MEDEKLMNEWRRGNDAAEGFPVGLMEHTPEEAAIYHGMTVLRKITPEGAVYVKDKNNALLVIANHNGPWAVKVSGKWL